MLSFPTPGDLPDPGTEPTSLASPALAGRFFTIEPIGKLLFLVLAPTLLSYVGLRKSLNLSDLPFQL